MPFRFNPCRPCCGPSTTLECGVSPSPKYIRFSGDLAALGTVPVYGGTQAGGGYEWLSALNSDGTSPYVVTRPFACQVRARLTYTPNRCAPPLVSLQLYVLQYSTLIQNPSWFWDYVSPAALSPLYVNFSSTPYNDSSSFGDSSACVTQNLNSYAVVSETPPFCGADTAAPKYATFSGPAMGALGTVALGTPVVSGSTAVWTSPITLQTSSGGYWSFTSAHCIGACCYAVQVTMVESATTCSLSALVCGNSYGPYNYNQTNNTFRNASANYGRLGSTDPLVYTSTSPFSATLYMGSTNNISGDTCAPFSTAGESVTVTN